MSLPWWNPLVVVVAPNNSASMRKTGGQVLPFAHFRKNKVGKGKTGAYAGTVGGTRCPGAKQLVDTFSIVFGKDSADSRATAESRQPPPLDSHVLRFLPALEGTQGNAYESCTTIAIY